MLKRFPLSALLTRSSKGIFLWHYTHTNAAGHNQKVLSYQDVNTLNGGYCVLWMKWRVMTYQCPFTSKRQERSQDIAKEELIVKAESWTEIEEMQFHKKTVGIKVQLSLNYIQCAFDPMLPLQPPSMVTDMYFYINRFLLANLFKLCNCTKTILNPNQAMNWMLRKYQTIGSCSWLNGRDKRFRNDGIE